LSRPTFSPLAEWWMNHLPRPSLETMNVPLGDSCSLFVAPARLKAASWSCAAVSAVALDGSVPSSQWWVTSRTVLKRRWGSCPGSSQSPCGPVPSDVWPGLWIGTAVFFRPPHTSRFRRLSGVTSSLFAMARASTLDGNSSG
jgi:hypothetical protein